LRIFTWPGNIHGYFKFVRGLALSVPRREQLYEINAVIIEKQLTFTRAYIRLYLKSRIKGNYYSIRFPWCCDSARKCSVRAALSSSDLPALGS